MSVLDAPTGPSVERRAPSAGAAPDPRRVEAHSALYEGTIAHRRHIDVGHAFRQPIVMAYLDLDEVDHAFDAHPLWSTSRPAPVRFRRRDMHGDPGLPLAHAVRRTIADAGGPPGGGPIRVLTHLRHWGWTFNPISLYFCFDDADTHVENLVVEVTNTPWHERHAYVLPLEPAGPGATQEVRFAKELHVSPFMDLDLDHVLRFAPPGEALLTVEMEDRRRDGDGDADGDELVFSARLSLRRRPLDRSAMSELLRRHLLPSHRVTLGIYRNALHLWRRGAPFRHHPDRSRP